MHIVRLTTAAWPAAIVGRWWQLMTLQGRSWQIWCSRIAMQVASLLPQWGQGAAQHPHVPVHLSLSLSLSLSDSCLSQADHSGSTTCNDMPMDRPTRQGPSCSSRCPWTDRLANDQHALVDAAKCMSWEAVSSIDRGFRIIICRGGEIVTCTCESTTTIVFTGLFGN